MKKVDDNPFAKYFPDEKGCVIIPEGTKEFSGYELGNAIEITSVSVPGSVKKIGCRAFSACKNLQSITLAEGVELVEQNAFTGCEKLTEVMLPASVKQINGWAFYHSGLTKPVLNAAGDTLIFCPAAVGSTYVVPATVKEIGQKAFIQLPELKQVVLPEGLQRVRSMAFVECGLEELKIPVGTVVEAEAFYECKSLRQITGGDSTDLIQSTLQYFHYQGACFLVPYRPKLPEEKYWKERVFRTLAKKCGDGRPEAMEAMVAYFCKKQEAAETKGSKEESAFFCAAADFWRVRAYLYGSEAVRRALEEGMTAHPGRQRNTIYLTEKLQGNADGEQLNALGFLFFEAGRFYNVKGIDKDGVVEASAYESEDGPDEDGFGRENYYDWWYLDDCLTLPKGVAYLHSYSLLDKRNLPERFAKLHDKVAAVSRTPQRSIFD